MKTLSTLGLKSILLSLLLSGTAFSASTTHYFNQVTDNGDTNVSAQLSVNITEGVDGAYFTFYNNVGTASSLSQVYFNDSANIFSDFSFDSQYERDAAGHYVDWETSESHGNFGAGVGFTTTTSFKKNNAVTDGVDNSIEWVKLFADYNTGMDFLSLTQAIADSSFQLGLHVISIAQLDGSDPQSEKFVNFALAAGDPSQVPLPAALWLFGPALLGFLGFRKKAKA